MIDILLLVIGLAALTAGTITDIKTREIPDWISFTTITAGLGLRLIYSLTTSDWAYFLYGFAGFLSFMLIGFAMFYAGQWGGGDTKLIMGIGAIFATYPSTLLETLNPNLNYSFLLAFMVNLAFVGALYGIVWSIFLAIKHRKEFIKEMSRVMQNEKIKRIKISLLVLLTLTLAAILVTKDQFMKIAIGSLALLTLLTFYTTVYIKVVEKTCMLKRLDVAKLTEGDWIAEDIAKDKKVFIKKTVMGNVEVSKIKDFIEGIDKKINIIRTYLWTIKLSREVRLSSIEEGDISDEDMHCSGLKIKKGEMITKEKSEEVNNYLRQNTLLDVKLTRRFLFFFTLDKKLNPELLKKGDFLKEDISVAHCYAGPRDLGISEAQIAELKKSKITQVLVKEGIPFIPSFLITLLVSLIFGNILFKIVGV